MSDLLNLLSMPLITALDASVLPLLDDNATTSDIILTPKMGGVYALSTPSRDTTAIKIAAKHDFNVSMHKVALEDGRELPNKYTAINDSTNELLGGEVVSSIYTPVQPDTIYDFVDHILNLDEKAEITDIVNMPNKIGMQIKLNEWSPTGEKNDTLEDNLTILNGYDSKASFTTRSGSFRNFCSNQYQNLTNVYKIRNTLNNHVKIEEVKKLLSGLHAEIDEMNNDIQSLVNIAMTNGQATNWFSNLLTKGEKVTDLSKRAKTIHDDNMSEFEKLLFCGAGHEAGERTRYAAFNALTNYCTHKNAPSNAEKMNSSSQFDSNTSGVLAVLSNTGFNQLVNM